jgi:predicted dehydrogenase
MQRLRAGIIGLGVGQQHIAGYRSAGVDVVALCDTNSEKLLEVGRKYPECRILKSAEAILDAKDIDVVSIASYDHYHAKQVIRAISNGKHVFSEKPLCTSEKELEAIRNLLSSHPEIRLSTNTILRRSKHFREIHQRITGGDLGKIYHVEADYNYGRIEKIMSGWRGKISDYSVMLGGGIHMVDLLIWMVGSPVLEVSAIGNKLCSEGAFFSTPDMVIAWLRFANGTIGKVGANFGCVYPHFHKVGIYGTKGTFENGIGGGILIQSRDPADSPLTLTSADPFPSKGDLIPSFVDAILGKGRADVDETDVLRAMAACLAIDRSLKTGKTESVTSY